MNQNKIRISFHFAYFLIDIICLSSVYYSCYLYRYIPDIWSYILTPERWGQLQFFAISDYTAVFLFWCALVLFSLNRYNLFITDRNLSIAKESWLVFKAVSFAVIPTAAAIFMMKFKVYSRFVFIASWVGTFILLCVWRAGKRLYIRHRIKEGLGQTRVLIVGAGTVTETIINEFKNHPYLGFELIGVLSLEGRPDETLYGVKVLGNYDDLEKIVQKYYVDEVFITTILAPKELETYILLGSKLKCRIKVIPGCFEHIYGNFRVYNLGYTHFLEYSYKRQHGPENILKRFFDILCSYIFLIILWPLFLVTAILIKLEDGGPVFYVSKRVGKKGKIFDFYKIRSMVVNADKLKNDLIEKNDISGPVFKIKKDPRITKIGRFIRKYSIDELPQLWNVLKGDISLVGPRPPVPEEVARYELWQMRKLDVMPGITCLWQVRGRSNLGFYKWIKWDLWYIDNWSFWLDLKILLWTIPVVLKGEGAY